MLPDRREFPCETVNVSPGGIALAAPERAEVGARIVAYFEEIGRVEGAVTRHLPSGFAMSVLATIAKRERLAEQLTWLANRQDLGIAEDRTFDRIVPQMMRSSLKLADGSEHWAVIVDISRSGVAIRTDAPMEIGDLVIIGKTQGRLVRRFPGGVALEFLRLIPIEEFDESIRL